MYGDFSRDSSTAIRNRRVFMQQGRVLLDADFNDQVASLVHTLETLAADLIGPHGGPEESFRVCEQCGSLKAKPGHYYVKGLLCEAAEEKPIETPTKAGYHIVYLDAWERHVTTAEDPSLREPALRGAETASRTRIQYNFEIKDLEKNEFEELLAKRNYPRCNSTPIGPQRQRFHGCSPFGWIAARVVDLLSFPASVSVPISPEQRDGHEIKFYEAFQDWLKAKLQLSGPQGKRTLQAQYVRANEKPPSTYGGFANRLYRIEIHRGGASEKATFKWSRDNGSFTFAAAGNQSLSANPVDGKKMVILKISDPLRECGQRIQQGQWVELFDAKAANLGAGRLMRVRSVKQPNNDGEAELALEATEKIDMPTPIFIRLWDHARSLALEANKNTNQNQPVEPLFGAVPISRATTPTRWFELEDGLQIQFTDPASIYQPGDSWLIKVRAQGELLSPVAPICTEHAYAPLALIEVTAGGKVRVHADCRRIIRPTALMQ